MLSVVYYCVCTMLYFLFLFFFLALFLHLNCAERRKDCRRLGNLTAI